MDPKEREKLAGIVNKVYHSQVIFVMFKHAFI